MATGSTDFSNQTVGQFPSGWTGWLESPSGWEIIDAPAPHSKSIQNTPNDFNPNAITWDEIGEVEDGEFYAEFGSNTTVPLEDALFAARLDTSANASSSEATLYRMGLRDDGIQIARYINGSFTSVATVARDFGLTDAEEVIAVRASLSGTTLKVRVWNKTQESEPGSWDLDVEDVGGVTGQGAFGYCYFVSRTDQWMSYFDYDTDTGSTGITGTLSAQESGLDVFTSTSTNSVSGSLSATESGTDLITAQGNVLVEGILSAQETGSDTLTAIGTVGGGVTGTLSVQETGTDTLTSGANVLVQGSLSSQESGQDNLSAIGTVGEGDTVAFYIFNNPPSAYKSVGGESISSFLAFYGKQQ